MLAILILYTVGAFLTLYWFERRAAIPLPRGVTIASSCAWPVFWGFEWVTRVVEWQADWLRRPGLMSTIEAASSFPMSAVGKDLTGYSFGYRPTQELIDDQEGWRQGYDSLLKELQGE